MQLSYEQLKDRDPAKTKDEARNISPLSGGALVIELAANDPKLSDEWFAVADTVTRGGDVLKSPLSLPADRPGDPGPHHPND